MYLINSNDKFFLKSLNNLLYQKNFPIMIDSDLQNYGQINFELNSTQLSISFNNENVLIKVPFSFNILWKNIFSVVSKNKVNFKNLFYFPLQETITSDDISIKLRHTHNLILRQVLMNKEKPMKKTDMYKTIWPNDVETHINKLDTHLTNLKNLLYENFKFKFHFQSQNGIIKFLID